MDKIWFLLKEQFEYLNIIFRIAKYENKASYQEHHLGVAWEILNPLLQVTVFYIIFGIGMREGEDVNGVPFLVFLITGQASWMFLSSCVVQGSSSIKGKLSLAHKMNFPLSILPTIFIAKNLKAFFVKVLISVITAAFFGIFPTIHWLQFIYYFVAMLVFLMFVSFFTSTVSILFLDFQFILATIMRLIFFTVGIMFPLEELRGRMGALFRLNPFHYIVSGFRNVLLYQESIGGRGNQTLFFWAFTLFIGLVGAHLHLKFREKFTDFT